jgi:hypothetical protein
MRENVEGKEDDETGEMKVRKKKKKKGMGMGMGGYGDRADWTDETSVVMVRSRHVSPERVHDTVHDQDQDRARAHHKRRTWFPEGQRGGSQESVLREYDPENTVVMGPGQDQRRARRRSVCDEVYKGGVRSGWSGNYGCCDYHVERRGACGQ